MTKKNDPSFSPHCAAMIEKFGNKEKRGKRRLFITIGEAEVLFNCSRADKARSHARYMALV